MYFLYTYLEPVGSILKLKLQLGDTGIRLVFESEITDCFKCRKSVMIRLFTTETIIEGKCIVLHELDE